MEREKQAIVGRAYAAFSGFDRPDRLFAHSDLEEGDFEEELAGVSRDGLTLAHLGTDARGPLPCFTPEALAHFMPRLIELALSGEPDRDGEPFFCRFINSFFAGPEGPRFRFFGPEQKKAMAAAFNFLCLRFGKELTREGWRTEAGLGRKRWEESGPALSHAPASRD